MILKCTICNEDKDSTCFYKRKSSTTGYYRHCKECHHKIVNGNYSENSEKYLAKKREYHSNNTEVLTRSYNRFKAKYPEKVKAHSILNNAVYRGHIKKPTVCSICGGKGRGKKSKIHAHHKDYTKPLDVVWVCAKCHKDIHMEKIVL